MKLAIMQPYFFPYIGYFSLMDYADQFIVLDTVQYDRKGWMNRNRILKPTEGWQYIRAGVKKPPYKALIKDVVLREDDEWKEMLIRQLEHYKKDAPFYSEISELVKKTLYTSAQTITELNVKALTIVRDYLKIDCPVHVYSDMDLEIGKATHPGQWALRISKEMEVDEYVNPIGGKKIFKSDEFQRYGIALTFLQHRLPKYEQFRPSFEAGLSIIDVLMFNSVNVVYEHLNKYDLLSTK